MGTLIIVTINKAVHIYEKPRQDYIAGEGITAGEDALYHPDTALGADDEPVNTEVDMYSL